MASAIETNSRKWRGIRTRVLKRDGGRCVVCKATATEVDHVVPRQLGGGDTWDNLQAMCSACHRRKSEYDRRRILELVAHVARVGVVPVADAGAVLRSSGDGPLPAPVSLSPSPGQRATTGDTLHTKVSGSPFPDSPAEGR